METPRLTVGDIVLIQKALDVYRTRAAASDGPKINALIKKLDSLEIREIGSGEVCDDHNENSGQDFNQDQNQEQELKGDADMDALLEKFNKLGSGKGRGSSKRGAKNSNYDNDVDSLLERFNNCR